MKRALMVILGLSAMGQSLILAQGKFGGHMFGDYYYNVTRDQNFNTLANTQPSSAMPGSTAMQGFQFRRIYLTYDNDISEIFASRFRLEADQSANASNGKIGTFVKDAYLRWKNIFAGSDLFFGIQPPPAYEVSEAAWGFRSLEKTQGDLRGFVSSRDFGLSLKGKVTSDGMVNYWIMIGNNSANSPAASKYKRYYGHIEVKPTTNLHATVYADFKDAADIKDAATGNMVGNGTLTTAFFVGYSEPFKYNINAELFMSSQSNGYKPASGALGSKSALAFSVYGTYFVLPELGVLARYDNLDPNADAGSKGDVRNYFLAGLSWKVDKNVQIMPNVVYETYELPNGVSNIDPSTTARLTLYYVFL